MSYNERFQNGSEPLFSREELKKGVGEAERNYGYARYPRGLSITRSANTPQMSEPRNFQFGHDYTTVATGLEDIQTLNFSFQGRHPRFGFAPIHYRNNPGKVIFTGGQEPHARIVIYPTVIEPLDADPNSWAETFLPSYGPRRLSLFKNKDPRYDTSAPRFRTEEHDGEMVTRRFEAHLKWLDRVQGTQRSYDPTAVLIDTTFIQHPETKTLSDELNMANRGAFAYYASACSIPGVPELLAKRIHGIPFNSRESMEVQSMADGLYTIADVFRQQINNALNFARMIASDPKKTDSFGKKSLFTLVHFMLNPFAKIPVYNPIPEISPRAWKTSNELQEQVDKLKNPVRCSRGLLGFGSLNID